MLGSGVVTYDAMYSERRHRAHGGQAVTLEGASTTTIATHLFEGGERGRSANLIRTRYNDARYLGKVASFSGRAGRGENP